MTYRGRIKNGQITLDEPAQLPEGARVTVNVQVDGDEQLVRKRRTQRLALDRDLAQQIATSAEFQPDDV